MIPTKPTRAKLSIKDLETMLIDAKRSGERTWLKSSPYPFLIVDFKVTELGILQALISGFHGKVWLTMVKDDEVFNL